MGERERQLEDIIRWLAREVKLVKGRPDDRYAWEVHADPNGSWQAWICAGWEGAEYGDIVADPPNELLLIEVLRGIDSRHDADA